MSKQEFSNEIAIIGMSARFPGADNLDLFWRNLCEGVESVSFFSKEELKIEGIDTTLIDHPSYINAKAILDKPEYFDASFFGYSPVEAETIDPQQRLFLESAWNALENAGYDPEKSQMAVGVFGTSGMSTYLLSHLAKGNVALDGEMNYQLMLGNDKDYLATRTSYKLNLNGPSINVHTACSSSLVAVHLACQSLLSGECDTALAGGSFISFPHKSGYIYKKGMILSPDGHCRAFDQSAAGTVEGNGVGIVVLKRMSDAVTDKDHILAVIKGSAINNDGSLKAGYTAPSLERQTAVIDEAISVAQVDPETINYIETHGTGTPLGDSIEIQALMKAFGKKKGNNAHCALGSVKTNIGHLNSAAGIAGLLKVVLSLKNGKIPPSLHYKEPNQNVDWGLSPFFVNDRLLNWPRDAKPRRAGLSSFGIGGTNVHFILEEAPKETLEADLNKNRASQLLLMSAKTPTALETISQQMAKYLETALEIPLSDIAYTLHLGRHGFDHRQALVCTNHSEAANTLRIANPNKLFRRTRVEFGSSMVWMFPGQGAQYPNMGQGLYQNESIFRETVDRCCRILQRHLEFDLRHILFPLSEKEEESRLQLNQTFIAQPALFVIEYALACLLNSWGLKPQAVIGHSIGEYVAATLASIFSLEDALTLVSARGRLMQNLPTGSMIAVAMSQSEISSFLVNEHFDLAAINSKTSCVLSGPTAEIEKIKAKLTNAKIGFTPLHTSHAFHSAMMDPILQDFSVLVKQCKLSKPQLPILSNLTGTWLAEEQGCDPFYWVQQLRKTVNFSSMIDQAAQLAKPVFLEVGPGHMLTTLSRQGRQIDSISTLASAKERQNDLETLLCSIGQLWIRGFEFDEKKFYQQQNCKRKPLPTYPFERKYYSLGHSKQAESENIHTQNKFELKAKHTRGFMSTNYKAPSTAIESILVQHWQDIFGISPVGVDDHFLELGGNSLMGIQFLHSVRQKLGVDIPIRKFFESPTISAFAEIVLDSILNLNDTEAAIISARIDDVILN